MVGVVLVIFFRCRGDIDKVDLRETQDAEEAAGQGSDADILCNLTFVSPAAPQRRISHPLLGLSFLSICHHSLEALASTLPNGAPLPRRRPRIQAPFAP